MPFHPRSAFPIRHVTLLVGLFVVAGSAGARNYFFDSNQPAAVGDGQGPATAWKNLASLTGVVLKPGDSVLLARDGIWRETLRLSASGTEFVPLVVAPYGTGTAAPEIRGSDSVVAPLVGGERQAKLMDLAKGVYAQGAPLRLARYPDTGWMIAGGLEGDTVVVASGLGATDWTGATVFLRSAQWTLEAHRVLRGTGGRLVLDRKLNYTPDSVRFFLANHVAAWGSGGDWYQSPDSVLHWRDPAGSDHSEVAVRAVGVDLRGANFVTVQGLRVFGTTQQGILFNGWGVRIDACDLRFPGMVGIQMNGRRSESRHNFIVGAWGAAVTTTGVRQVVYGNRIRNTGRQDWLGPDGVGTGCCGGPGVVTTGDSSIVRRNDIDSSGLNAITFKGLASQIDSNHLAHSCMTTDDCGTIHTWAGQYPVVGSANSVIRHNIVRDAVGAPSGVRKYYPAYQGIYLDDGSHDIRVDSNIVIGNYAGIFLHNCQRDTVRGNLVYGNQSAQILLQHDNLAGPADMVDNLIQGNTLVSLAGQSAAKTLISRPQTAPLATWVDNLYCLDEPLITGCRREAVEIWHRDHLAAVAGRGPETQRNYGFDAAQIGWTAWPATAAVARDSGVGGGGACLRFGLGRDSLARGGLTNGNLLVATTLGDWWLLEFRAKGGGSDQNLEVVFRRSFGDYAKLGKIPAVRLDTAWQSFRFLFQATQTEPKARLDFGMTALDSVVWLDDVSLRTLPAAVIQAQLGSRILTKSPSRLTPTLPAGRWIDVSGGSVTPPQLGDYQGAVWFADETEPVGVRREPSPGPRLRLRRQGRGWVVSGLSSPATVRDAQGRWLQRLEPDGQGRAVFVPPPGEIVWLQAGGQSQALVVLD